MFLIINQTRTKGGSAAEFFGGNFFSIEQQNSQENRETIDG